MREHALEVCATQSLARTASPCADRNPAGDLVHERLASPSELIGAERKREQPHAAVDVIAHAPR